MPTFMSGGTLTMGGSSVTSPSGSDIFVLKTSSSGVPSWLVSAEGNTSCSCSDNVDGLALDASGNTYITGTFNGSFGWQTVFGTDTISGFNSRDVYVAKLNDSGVFQWAEPAGSSNDDYGIDVAQDGTGNVYVGGSANGDFGAFVYFSHVSYAPGGSAGFVGKVNANLHTGTVSAVLCNGTSVSVPYTSDVTMIAGNVYTVQLSDANGLFNSPTTLGTKTTKSASDSISVTIPAVAGGSAYRIRMISSSPLMVGRDNGKDISIGTMSTPIITPSGPITACTGDMVILSTSTCSNCNYQWKKGSSILSGETYNSLATTDDGTFKVSVTNFGCSKTSGGVKITRTSPTATVTPSGTVDICSTGSVVLTASAGAGYSYKWKKGSAYISGATDITCTAAAKGNYKVEVTDAIGCIKTSTATKVVKSCRESDLIAEEEQATITLCPNPANEKLMINYTSVIVSSLEIYDELGRKVIEQQIRSGECSPEFMLDVSGLSSGVYFIRLVMEDGNKMTEKFVKE